METKTYHAKIGFPSTYRRPVGSVRLSQTKHAAVMADERGITIPTHINFRYANIFEIDMNGNKVSKVVFRSIYDRYNDICMAVSLERGKAVVITAWLNSVSDNHTTLHHSRYSRP